MRNRETPPGSLAGRLGVNAVKSGLTAEVAGDRGENSQNSARSITAPALASEDKRPSLFGNADEYGRRTKMNWNVIPFGTQFAR